MAGLCLKGFADGVEPLAERADGRADGAPKCLRAGWPRRPGEGLSLYGREGHGRGENSENVRCSGAEEFCGELDAASRVAAASLRSTVR